MPFITSQNARELAKLAQEARRINHDKQYAPTAKDSLNHSDRYTIRRLARTRKQIDAISKMIEVELDPQKIDRLASALARLSEIERQLANRPLPGSWKPTQSPKRRPWTGDTGPTPIDTPTPSVPAQPNVISNPNPLTDNKTD